MNCPNCNNQIDDSKLCTVCGTELDYIETEDKYHVWEVLYTTNDMIEAELIKANFDSINMPVEILSQQDSMRMFTVGDLSIIKLMIPKEFSVEAKSLLNDLLNEISEDIDD